MFGQVGPPTELSAEQAHTRDTQKCSNNGSFSQALPAAALNPHLQDPAAPPQLAALRSSSQHRRAYSDTWPFLSLLPPELMAMHGLSPGALGAAQMQSDSNAMAALAHQQLQPQLQHPHHTPWQSHSLPMESGLPGLAPLPVNNSGNGSMASTSLHVDPTKGGPYCPPIHAAVQQVQQEEDEGRPRRSSTSSAQPSPCSQSRGSRGAGGYPRVQKNPSMKRSSTTRAGGRADQDLATLDPDLLDKHERRILANRQSAQRSKERRLHATFELEHKLAQAQDEHDEVSATAEELRLDNDTLMRYNEDLLATVPQLQNEHQQLEGTSKVLVDEILQVQRMLGLPLKIPSGPKDLQPHLHESLLPLPCLRRPLGSGV